VANSKHVKLLKWSVEDWNEWRRDNPTVTPKLGRADLRSVDLSRADLSGADLSGADLREAHLHGADLTAAHLRHADLIGADLTGANLSEADLSSANLSEADLSNANLTEADLICTVVPVVSVVLALYLLCAVRVGRVLLAASGTDQCAQHNNHKNGSQFLHVCSPLPNQSPLRLHTLRSS